MNNNMEILGLINQAKQSKTLNNKRILLFGIFTHSILSKEFMNKNSNIPEFIHLTLKVEFKEYVYQSRTMVIARVSRIIEKMEINEINKTLDVLNHMFTEIENPVNTTEKARKKKNSVLDTIDNWLRVIDNE
ncbi:hypothetical protein IUK39_03395 [Priestia aryabhattai]|uniref:hypothetical protein n=1 Tax=Priestia aryabhattai TaxID=412384 RepID=UPI001C0CAC68|nr:hypothetical protein [Priestia aryabhattai]MBU3569222.1 hypothetical protein [Priestia aryabhattai]